VSDTSDDDGVRAANSAFYAALESRDLDAMSEVWEHSDRIVVTHPGWPMLRGWARVAGSWDAIFRNTGYIQFVLTDELVTVVGDSAWVTLDENILQSAGEMREADELSGSNATSVNVFVRDEDDGTRWRMVVHHASPVSAEG
jgi:ketosteroid isomerase-like protein